MVRLGVGLLDEYLVFLSGRCRPNTVLAVASWSQQPKKASAESAGIGQRLERAGEDGRVLQGS